MARLSFTWFGHAAVELRTNEGRRILVDPWLGNPRSPASADDVDACDLLLVTHGHFDHMGADPGNLAESDAVRIARRTKPAWPCIHELSLWLGTLDLPGVDVIGMNKGGTVEHAGIGVTMVHADHSAGDIVTATGATLYLGEPVGFVIELRNGTTVYVSGDTTAFGDMSLIRRFYAPEIAFLPIGGHFTMGPREAALAADMLGVHAVVPVHWGTFPLLAGTPDDLRHELDLIGLDSVEVVAPEPGEEREL